jgi:hypothetical protein
MKKLQLASLAAKNPSETLIAKYKAYRNLYNKTLRAGKRKYFETQLTKNISNLKRTWELIRAATNSGGSKNAPFSKLIIDGITYSDSYQIACKLNEFFTTMQSNIANNIPHCEDATSSS